MPTKITGNTLYERIGAVVGVNSPVEHPPARVKVEWFHSKVSLG